MTAETIWHRREIYYPIPSMLMVIMLRRAQQWSWEHGGRFAVTPRAIYLIAPDGREVRRPIAAVYFRHLVCGTSIDALAWHPELSSENELRQALWLLARVPD